MLNFGRRTVKCTPYSATDSRTQPIYIHIEHEQSDTGALTRALWHPHGADMHDCSSAGAGSLVRPAAATTSPWPASAVLTAAPPPRKAAYGSAAAGLASPPATAAAAATDA